MSVNSAARNRVYILGLKNKEENSFYAASESPASIAARLHLLFRRRRRSSSEIWWDFPSPLFLSPFFPFCVSLFLLCRPPPPPREATTRRRQPTDGWDRPSTLTTAHLKKSRERRPPSPDSYFYLSRSKDLLLASSFQRTNLAMRLANPNWFTIRGKLYKLNLVTGERLHLEEHLKLRSTID